MSMQTKFGMQQLIPDMYREAQIRGNSGQLRQPQVPESIARGKNLLVIIPIIFARQHFCYFYYTCMSS